MGQEIYRSLSVVHALVVLTALISGAIEPGQRILQKPVAVGAGRIHPTAVSKFLPTLDQLRRPPDGWRQVSNSSFSFWLPPELVGGPKRGIDSAIWEYRSDHARLSIDYGMYSSKCRGDLHFEYDETRAKIGGMKAVLCTYRVEGDKLDHKPYVSQLSFHDFRYQGLGLVFYYSSDTKVDRPLARQIFSSIEFSRRVHKRVSRHRRVRR